MRNILFIAISLFIFASCSFIDSVFYGDVVARVGNSVLYEKDIEGLLPKGTSPNDSALLVSQYINTWATKKLLLANAENRLSREDKDVEQEISDYKTSLLVFRYEKLYVEKNLDTLISEHLCRDYYERYKGSFVYPYSIVKGRFIKISISSPNVKMIESFYHSDKLDDMDEVDRLAKSSAEKYIDSTSGWIPLSYISKEFGEELSILESKLNSKRYFTFEKDNYLYLVRSYERVSAGEITPYDFNTEYIKESILSKRKQDLILNLERTLLEDALKDNKLIIYSKDND